MSVVDDPAVQRLRLGRQLRVARENAGQKQSDVAKATDMSLSKLIRIESGQVGVLVNDVRALMGQLGITEPQRVAALLEAARASRNRSWYDGYSDVLRPAFREYLSYEASAARIRQYEPLIVPGLAQVRDYARAVLRVFEMSGDESDRMWEVREHRQELHEREEPPDVRIILDEAVIRRQVGGPEVMRRQLQRLDDLASSEHFTLQILPFRIGPHPGMYGPFAVMQFDDPFLDDLVHLESADQTTLKDDPEATARYVDRFTRLSQLALSEPESRALLHEAIQQLDAAGETRPVAQPRHGGRKSPVKSASSA